jgi:hypothetical protein
VITKEREQEIRRNANAGIGFISHQKVCELLSEIDSLRSQLADADRVIELVKAENERFRRDYDKHDLILENERLKERISKLKEAILWASPCGQNWIPLEHHPSYETIGKVMTDALAEDSLRAAKGK